LAGYLTAVTSATLNTGLFLTNFRKYCFTLIFIFISGIWAGALTVCQYKPSHVSATISIVFNSLCLLPLCNILRKKAQEVCRTNNNPSATHRPAKQETSNVINLTTESQSVI
jgi:hypothetical protein